MSLEWHIFPASDLGTRNSQGNSNGFDDFAENGFRRLGFFLQGRVARASHDAMRENGNRKLLEIVGQAIVASVEERAGLRGPLQHQGAAGADAERKLVRLARAIDN